MLKNLSLHFSSFAGVRKALIYTIASKVCGGIYLPLQILLITRFFSPELQGYFYTFQAILALQIFAELGLTNIIVYFTAHEWSSLSLNQHGEIVGDSEALSRMRGFALAVRKIFFISTFLFVVFVGIGGALFLASQPCEHIQWLLPWIALILAGGLQLFLLPALSFLEGAGAINEVSFLRLGKLFILAIVSSVAIGLGMGLWSISLALFSSALWLLFYILKKRRNFFNSLFSKNTLSTLSWKKEIFPLQWKIGVSFLSGYFAFSLLSPLIFHCQGAVAAGKVGMTLLITQGIMNLSSIWISIHTPRLGGLISRGEEENLRVVFSQIVKLTLFTVLLSTLSVWVVIKLADYFECASTKRILSSPSLEVFLLGNLLLTAAVPFAIYLRAHKEEPLLGLSLFYALALPLSTLYFARNYSLFEVGLGYLWVNLIGFIVCITIWKNFKRRRCTPFGEHFFHQSKD